MWGGCRDLCGEGVGIRVGRMGINTYHLEEVVTMHGSMQLYRSPAAAVGHEGQGECGIGITLAY